MGVTIYKAQIALKTAFNIRVTNKQLPSYNLSSIRLKKL